jgi:restriction system protein
MANPDYETLLLPLLKIAGDGQERRVSDVVDLLARDFKLTEEGRQQLLPSGKQTTFGIEPPLLWCACSDGYFLVACFCHVLHTN